MKENSFFKKNLIFSMIIGIVVAIFGIILMFQAIEFFSYVILLYGLYSIFVGVRGLLFATKLIEQRKTKNVNLVSSIFSIVIGIIIIVYPYFTSTVAITIVIYLLAAQLLINGLSNIFSSIGLSKTDFYNSSFLISGIINLVIAAIFFIFPTQVAQFFLKVIGIICIFYGLGLFFWSFRIRKINKEFEKNNIDGTYEKVDE